jgi:hypothetical protein
MKIRLLAAAMFSFAIAFSLSAIADDPTPGIAFHADQVGPRTLEAATQKALARDYAAAWKTLLAARSSNQPTSLDEYFIGQARTKLGNGIAQQAKAGLKTRYVDQGHDVKVVFYSKDGMSVQLLDVARFSVELLDGDKVIDRQEVRRPFVAVMTPTEVRWKVRILEEDIESPATK